MSVSDEEAKAAWNKAQGMKMRGTGFTLQKESVIVAVVLFAFAFCGMYFFLHEPFEKSVFFGLVGGAIGTFRYAMRSMMRRK
jgi:hypothetical protein